MVKRKGAYHQMTNSILADRIEQFILERLGKQSSDELLLRRKDVADLLECAPSQVTYVINTRFSSDNRFMVESRRGSGGYIKISMRGVAEKDHEIVSHTVSEKKGETDKNDIELVESNFEGYFNMLLKYNIISRREYHMIKVLMRTMLEFCPPEDRQDAVITIIHQTGWTLKGE